jgi:hypothetical protein
MLTSVRRRILFPINGNLSNFHAFTGFQHAGSREYVITKISDFATHDVVFREEGFQTADLGGEIFTKGSHALFEIDVACGGVVGERPEGRMLSRPD